MKKSGAFLLVAFLIVAIIGIVTYSILVFKTGEEKPMLAPPAIGPIKNCSDTSVKGIWDLVFYESSTGINIVTNTSRQDFCEKYYAWKQVGDFTYILAGSFWNDNASFEDIIYQNASYTEYLWGNYTQYVNSTFLTLTSAQVGAGDHVSLIIDLLNNADTVAKNWSIPITPDGVFSSKFEYVNETPFESSLNYYSFEYEDEYMLTPGGTNFSYNFWKFASGAVHITNQTTSYWWQDLVTVRCSPNWTCSGWGTCNGTVQNRTCSDQKNCGILYGRPALTQSCSPACVPNWTAVQATPCNATESFVIWYNDTNRCQNVTAPGNITGYCDYDGNGLIGRLSDIVDDNLDIDILKIDDKVVNYSKNYTGDEDVELIEDEDDVEIVRVKFRYDFDDEPLNLKTIRVEKQNEDSDFGYLIVEGLDVDNKEFRVDKVYHSDAVCVKDDGLIDDPSDIDEFCGGDEEYYVACPGIRSEFNCTDGGEGTYLVKGMDHSGVRELEDSITSPPPPGNQTNQTCQAIWDCGLWGQCVNGVQRRLCTDLSSCPNVTKSYNQTQACTGDCTPDWECGAWTPTDCEAGEEQTQVCVDLNGCSEDETRNRECSEEGGIDWLLIGIIIGAGVIVLAAVILIIIVKRRRDAAQAEEKNSPIQTLQRPPAGSYNPTHYGMYGGYGYRR